MTTFKLISWLAIILVITVLQVQASDFAFEITDQQAYSDKLAALDHKLQAIRQLRAYTRRYQAGEVRSHPITLANIEEITKAHSKAVEEANDMVVKILSQDKRNNILQHQKETQTKSPQANMMNFILEKNRILYQKLNGVSNFVTNFSTGGPLNYLLLITSAGQDSGSELLIKSGDNALQLHQLPLVDKEKKMIAFDHGKDLIYFPSTPLGQGSGINGIIFTAKDRILYSYKLSMVNGTIPDLRLLGQRTLDQEMDVQQVLAIRQRGAGRVLVYDNANQNITMFSPDLKKKEASQKISRDQPGLVDIVPQPLSLLLLRSDSIDFYKLASNAVQARNGSCIASDGVKLDKVMFSPSSAGTLIALSKNTNQIVVFEARGKGGQFSCKQKGVIAAPANLQMTSLKLNSQADIIYVTFESSNQIGMLNFEPKRVFPSLVQQDFANSKSKLITLADQNIAELHSSYSSIILEHATTGDGEDQVQFSIFENTFGSVKTSTQSGQAGGADEKGATESGKGSTYTYLIVPLAVAAVLIYQLYCKTSPKRKHVQEQQARAQAQRGPSTNSKFQKGEQAAGRGNPMVAGLRDEVMGGLNDEMTAMREQLSGMGDMAGLKEEVANMKAQLGGLTSGADGMTNQMKNEMDAMRQELSGLTAGLQTQLGSIANMKGAAGRAAGGQGGPQKRSNPAQSDSD